jgi:hypothetical protein
MINYRTSQPDTGLRDIPYTEDQLTSENTTKVYSHYGIELSTIEVLTF